MKNLTLLTLIILFNPFFTMAQQLDYFPEQRPNVSDKDYSFGIKILQETYDKVKQDGGVFTYADYWNIALAYVKLKDDLDMARELLHKSQEESPLSFSKVFLYMEGLDEPGGWKDHLPADEYDKFMKDSEELVPEKDRVKPQQKKEKIVMPGDQTEASIFPFFRKREAGETQNNDPGFFRSGNDSESIA